MIKSNLLAWTGEPPDFVPKKTLFMIVANKNSDKLRTNEMFKHVQDLPSTVQDVSSMRQLFIDMGALKKPENDLRVHEDATFK